MNTNLIIIIAIIAIIIISIIVIYNGFVTKRNDAKNAFATIDVMLKRRFDLIPNLVASVKQYATHELTTFAVIAELRRQSFESMSKAQKQRFGDEMKIAAQQYSVVAEKYPELKASENFLQLQRALNETEEQLSAARRTYNAAVARYNTSIQKFPNSIFAQMFGFKDFAWYEAKQSERENQKISM